MGSNDFEAALRNLNTELHGVHAAFIVSAAAFEWTSKGGAQYIPKDENKIKQGVKEALDSWFKEAV